MKRGIFINNHDLDEGNLMFDSVVVPCKIFNPTKRRIIKKIGKLNKNKSIDVVKFLNVNIKIE